MWREAAGSPGSGASSALQGYHGWPLCFSPPTACKARGGKKTKLLHLAGSSWLASWAPHWLPGRDVPARPGSQVVSRAPASEEAAGGTAGWRDGTRRGGEPRTRRQSPTAGPALRLPRPGRCALGPSPRRPVPLCPRAAHGIPVSPLGYPRLIQPRDPDFPNTPHPQAAAAHRLLFAAAKSPRAQVKRIGGWGPGSAQQGARRGARTPRPPGRGGGVTCGERVRWSSPRAGAAAGGCRAGRTARSPAAS